MPPPRVRSLPLATCRAAPQTSLGRGQFSEVRYGLRKGSREGVAIKVGPASLLAVAMSWVQHHLSTEAPNFAPISPFITLVRLS